MLAVALAAASCRPAEVPHAVHAAVAANFAVPFAEIAGAFEASRGLRVATSTGATGALYAQIVAGAPFDVLLAADAERPRRLAAEGLAVAGSRFTYARGRLVLWSPGAAGPAGPELLAREDLGPIALANPKTAPYGAAARQALGRLGLWRAVEPRVVYGGDVGQAYQFVVTGNAAAGLLARSQLTAEQAATAWLVPEDLHDPLEQQAVLLARAAGRPAARELLAFLRGRQARAVLARHGYEVGRR